MSDFAKARLNMNALTIYRKLLEDETVSRFLALLSETESGDAASFCAAYGAFFHELSEQDCSLNFARHLENLVRYDDNAFSRAAANRESGSYYLLIRKAAEHDLNIIRSISGISAETIQLTFSKSSAETDQIAFLPDYFQNRESVFSALDLNDLVCELEQFHRESGFGLFAKYGAFRWTGELVGVPHPDTVRICDLKEYEYERGIVAANTLDFVEGRGGGNLLLYGDRGTGKSSTIKALANEYRNKGLRIVEITKEHISDLPGVLERLRGISQRFILFLDDLTFSTDDSAFSALKSILEGGIVAQPENCRVYATSNRRHLVKESFSERNPDDVHAGDTMQEKLALYDRFDQTVNFFAPDQARYLAIVRALAEERGLSATREALERGAVQWAIRAGGRSPRTAKQFVEWAQIQIYKGAPIQD